ncbi:MAG TPA: helix-hairpin-helix domain-containing protein [Gammaproteobacteria bacterium]
MKKLLGTIALLFVFLAGPTWAAPVNINTADAAALSAGITGVGEKKAEAIIKYRKEHGPFKSVDELVNVPGIGEKTVENNRNNLTIGKGNSAAEAKPATPAKAKSAQ